MIYSWKYIISMTVLKYDDVIKKVTVLVYFERSFATFMQSFIGRTYSQYAVACCHIFLNFV